jgi:phage host-nuclease inhibitor protein Gam
MYEYEIEDITNEKEPFVINTDGKADWACKVIKQEQADTERLQKTIDEEIMMLNEKKKYYAEQLENKTSFLKSKLANYFETVEKKELKTCFKYKLPSADLVFMKPAVKYERDNDKIISWLTEHNKFEFIKTNPAVDWAELKKTDFFKEIDGITEVQTDAVFKID